MSQNFNLENTSLFNFTKDTFDLTHSTRDPFLDKMNYDTKIIISPTIKKSGESRSLNSSNKRSKPKIESAVKWPKINYYGFVKGAKSSSELVLIKIDNKLHKIREGDQIDNIAIKKVYRDSIMVLMNKSLKSIKKN